MIQHVAAAVGRAGAGWAVRSKAALLLALVAKRQGPQLWAEVLPRLVEVAQQGPLQAEMARLALQPWSTPSACL